ncbi:hypothetical protein Tco_0751644 [Tanacetum coccineum]|uniref:Uncharacterized protein n=1 Tax=Tanacetum coccineum TaxID=301880 RepID=A0ABQ4Z886_9ASTR
MDNAADLLNNGPAIEWVYWLDMKDFDCERFGKEVPTSGLYTFESKKIAQVVHARIQGKNSLVKLFEDIRLCRPSKEYLQVKLVSMVDDKRRSRGQNEGELTLPNVYDLCISLMVNGFRSSQEKIIKLLIGQNSDQQAQEASKTCHQTFQSISEDCLIAAKTPKEELLKETKGFATKVFQTREKIAKEKSSVQRDPLFDGLLEDDRLIRGMKKKDFLQREEISGILKNESRRGNKGEENTRKEKATLLQMRTQVDAGTVLQGRHFDELYEGLVAIKCNRKKYPLKKEILVQMLKLKLESEEESTMALELIRFLKNVEVLSIPKQTATGKGTSNPLMAGSLPKTTKPT